MMNAGKCLDPRLSAIIHQKSELITLQQLQNQNSNWTFAVYCNVVRNSLYVNRVSMSARWEPGPGHTC